MYGHVKKLADSVALGLTEAGVEVKLFQIPETLTEEELRKMKAPPKPEDPIITPDQLVEADGFLFGIPTRFGMIASQMKTFFDMTGDLWLNGRLIGKPAGMFHCTGTQGGGQETTAMTAITQLAHHGMIYVPLGYSSRKLTDMSEVHGGSPYGAGTFAGADGSRIPSELELSIAKHQGKMFGETTKALVAGRQVLLGS
uniref:NAD(P)H dehydrogenase (quinone) n=1 Tax=Tetraselmis sp. GSL018 TaxID=582737 RepID=A0A061SN82_9CHLO|eukprot:CAMPEP_0177580618 /NCGR_PEP_ID=MMETSP0419_2-20121207/1664_1 /TAXON_ID=582737 /ORGANISM="Tetraselmis sp., Strain GSL018" /LENGTH=197 /DNA_ID=CAMNT_0019069513 /DNA_START=1 /DNA_END=594 /DNA_ORIENTATION=-